MTPKAPGALVNAPHLPFKILALAQLLGADCPVWEEAPLEVDLADPDRAIEELGPTCTVSIPRDLHLEEILEIKLRKFKDFHPDGLLQNIPILRNLYEAKTWTEEARRKNLSSQEISARLAKWPHLPPIRVETEMKKPISASPSSVDKILEMVAMPDESPGLPSGAQGASLQIDAILNQILGHIFRDDSFRSLEASWRGLKLLLRYLNIKDSDIRVEIVPVSFDSLEDTLGVLAAEVIDTLPSVLLVDLPLDNSPRCLGFLESIAGFSETLLVPAITWITPSFFHINSWRDLKKISFLPHYLAEPSFAKWQSMRKAASSGWVSVVCNRLLARYPYGKDNKPRFIKFEEKNRLWISPVWALGTLIGLSFAEMGWPTRFTDWQNVKLEDLPLNTEDPRKPIPTETSFDRDRADQFIRSGIVPLAAAPDKDIAFVPAETMVGGVSLSYQLLVSRITQLVLWCRDHFEKRMNGEELEAALLKAFNAFWERSGHMGPEDLEISAGETDPDGRIPVQITLQPSRQILLSPDKVELHFSW